MGGATKYLIQFEALVTPDSEGSQPGPAAHIARKAIANDRTVVLAGQDGGKNPPKNSDIDTT